VVIEDRVMIFLLVCFKKPDLSKMREFERKKLEVFEVCDGKVVLATFAVGQSPAF